MKFKLSIRMGKKGDLSDFEHGMFVGARESGTENGAKNRKYPVSSSCVDEKALLMSEVRGEWAEWLEMIERQQ